MSESSSLPVVAAEWYCTRACARWVGRAYESASVRSDETSVNGERRMMRGDGLCVARCRLVVRAHWPLIPGGCLCVDSRRTVPVSYTHLRAHETGRNLV